MQAYFRIHRSNVVCGKRKAGGMNIPQPALQRQLHSSTQPAALPSRQIFANWCICYGNGHRIVSQFNISSLATY